MLYRLKAYFNYSIRLEDTETRALGQPWALDKRISITRSELEDTETIQITFAYIASHIISITRSD